jgi:hypothetical protein
VLTYTRFLRLTIVVSLMAGGSAVGSTTAASPNALERVTGSRLTATRLAGITRVRSSTTTLRSRGVRLLSVLVFLAFFGFRVFLFGIQTSTQLKFMSRTGQESVYRDSDIAM